MAREVGEDNICVNAIAPGLVVSDALVEGGNWSEEWFDNNTNSHAFKRRTIPDDMVGTIEFLSSREANFLPVKRLSSTAGRFPIKHHFPRQR